MTPLSIKSKGSDAWFTYAGATALVTGASRGIGAAFVESLARRNTNIVLLARATDEMLILSQRMMREYGVHCECITMDLEATHAVRDLVTEIERRKVHIDLLINNAGYGLTGDFLSHRIEQEQGEIRLNIQALVALTHHFGTAMIGRGYGGIINLASNASFQPLPWMATYAATKAFVLHFSEALRYEVVSTGVHVMAACPGATATNFFGDSPAGLHLRGKDSAASVAERTLRAFDRKCAVAYPGRFGVRLATWLPRWLPRVLTVRMAAMAMKSSGVTGTTTGRP